jgi:hypothetical protein
VEFLKNQEKNLKFMIKSKLTLNDINNNSLTQEDFEKIKNEVLNLGFIRFSINGQLLTINDSFNNAIK